MKQPADETPGLRGEIAEALERQRALYAELTRNPQLIAALAVSPTGMGYDEMEKAAGLTTTSVWRALTALTAAGVVDRERVKTMAPGGSPVLFKLNANKIAAQLAAMSRLFAEAAEKTGEP